MTWNARLTEARERAGIKKTDFADLVRVSTATTTTWENGNTQELKAENLLTICDVLNISPYWLMRGTKPAFSQEELEIIACYKEAGTRGKEWILRTARLERNSPEKD